MERVVVNGNHQVTDSSVKVMVEGRCVTWAPISMLTRKTLKMGSDFISNTAVGCPSFKAEKA